MARGIMQERRISPHVGVVVVGTEEPSAFEQLQGQLREALALRWGYDLRHFRQGAASTRRWAE